MELGEKIRRRRLELGMSQADLADALGYTNRATVAKVESGVNDLTQSKIERYAEALRTTPAYLMDWTEIRTTTTLIRMVDSIPYQNRYLRN